MTKKKMAEEKIYKMQRFIFGLLDGGAEADDELVRTSTQQLIGMMRLAIEVELFTTGEMDIVLAQIEHAKICGKKS